MHRALIGSDELVRARFWRTHAGLWSCTYWNYVPRGQLSVAKQLKVRWRVLECRLRLCTRTPPLAENATGRCISRGAKSDIRPYRRSTAPWKSIEGDGKDSALHNAARVREALLLAQSRILSVSRRKQHCSNKIISNFSGIRQGT